MKKLKEKEARQAARKEPLEKTNDIEVNRYISIKRKRKKKPIETVICNLLYYWDNWDHGPRS